MTDYAVYKGDELIDFGNAVYLSKKLKLKIDTIYYLASPRNLRRNKGNRLIAIRLEDD